jgi:hypothetical protein
MRHENQDPVQPPLTLAVQMVGVGASFIRWLATRLPLREF